MNHKQAKIIFTGPAGSGKTSAITTVNQLDAISASGDSTIITTVGLDYGELALEEELVLRLYGTVSDDFPYLWRYVSDGADGYLLLVDNTREQPLSDMANFLDHFNFRIKKQPVVIGVTHMDKSDAPSVEDYEKFLKARKEEFPVVTVDARSREDVLMMLNVLFAQLDK